MSKFIMLIGLPASGKSTFAKNLFCPVFSTDGIIEDYAKSLGKTYNEVFQEVIGEAEEAFFQDIKWAVEDNKDFAVDRTNLSVKSRRRILNLIPKDYHKTAYVFECLDPVEHERRLNSRPGKTIPPKIIETMKNSFKYPDPSEGFDKIVHVRT